jgi:inosose dehydratase
MGEDAGEGTPLLNSDFGFSIESIIQNRKSKMIHVGNAPCSWGNLEFEGLGENKLTFSRMLDELVDAGYTGTELGDWGFMPTAPEALHSELGRRHLAMTGAFVPVAFRQREAHDDGQARAIRTAQLLAAVKSNDAPPFLVLADDNNAVPTRAKHAGRVTREMMLDKDAWRVFAEGVNRVARAVHEQTGLRCVFHHHCAGFVETPDEIATLLSLTDPHYVGLVFDTGHYAFGSGDPAGDDVMRAMDRFAARIGYVHLKDCSPAIATQSRAEKWDYNTSVGHGVFCELGAGCVPFGRVAEWLKQRDYQGFVTVEQDVLPGMGTPKESALRNRNYLRTIGL